MRPKMKKPQSIAQLHGFLEWVNAVKCWLSVRYRLRIVNQNGRAGAPERNSTVEKQEAVIPFGITASVNSGSDGTRTRSTRNCRDWRDVTKRFLPSMPQ